MSEVQYLDPNDVSETGLGGHLLALNNAHAQELSWLEPDRLTHLITQAFVASRIGSIEAFLLAFDQDADYDSPNFLWFRSQYSRFVYVDRIAVASAARGRGHARALYDDLFAKAARAGHDRVVCEVNSEPPNPGSDAFHAALGFSEVGTGIIHAGAKTVRYLARSALRLSRAPSAGHGSRSAAPLRGWAAAARWGPPPPA